MAPLPDPWDAINLEGTMILAATRLNRLPGHDARVGTGLLEPESDLTARRSCEIVTQKLDVAPRWLPGLRPPTQ